MKKFENDAIVIFALIRGREFSFGIIWRNYVKRLATKVAIHGRLRPTRCANIHVWVIGQGKFLTCRRTSRSSGASRTGFANVWITVNTSLIAVVPPQLSASFQRPSDWILLYNLRKMTYYAKKETAVRTCQPLQQMETLIDISVHLCSFCRSSINRCFAYSAVNI